MIAWPLLLLVLAQPAPAPPADIFATAPREEESDLAVPFGSRIAREKKDVGYQQIATDSGVQGLTPGSGMDPFAGPTRRVEIRECRSSDPTLGKGTVCVLAEASKHMGEGRWEEARRLLFRLAENPALAPVGRYVAAEFFYRIAAAQEDDLGRAEALEEMLATGEMAPDQTMAARKTLVALAVARGDDAAALAQLEMLVATDPADIRSQANLATLHARGGSHDKAVPRMEQAAALTEQAGRTLPKSWTDYLRDRR